MQVSPKMTDTSENNKDLYTESLIKILVGKIKEARINGNAPVFMDCDSR